MIGRIDVHSHLLPGVDDGCKSAAESIQCARMLVSAGYSHCFCTPHVWPNLAEQTRDFVRDRTRALQLELERVDVKLKLLPGAELNLNPQVTSFEDSRIISLALAGKYVLTDMWADAVPDWFERTIDWLQQKHNLTVILAHPERMRAVQDRPQLAATFAKMGVLLQGNLQCFADRPDADTRVTAERFIQEGRYFVLGSDTHDPGGLNSRLMGLENAISLVGERAIDQLTREAPSALLAGASLDTPKGSAAPSL